MMGKKTIHKKFVITNKDSGTVVAVYNAQAPVTTLLFEKRGAKHGNVYVTDWGFNLYDVKVVRLVTTEYPDDKMTKEYNAHVAKRKREIVVRRL